MILCDHLADIDAGSQIIQVRWPFLTVSDPRRALTRSDPRMLEDPSYESVVRWGNEGDSFVVLEVRVCC